MNMFVSIYLLTMLSVDRYISIVRVAFQTSILKFFEIQTLNPSTVGILTVLGQSIKVCNDEKHNLSKINENVTKSKAGFQTDSAGLFVWPKIAKNG